MAEPPEREGGRADWESVVWKRAAIASAAVVFAFAVFSYRAYRVAGERVYAIAEAAVSRSLEREHPPSEPCELALKPSFSLPPLSDGVGPFDIRLISVYPLNPKNTATPDEADALLKIRLGAERHGWRTQSGENTIFHYVAPVLSSPSCRECHKDQGEREGAVAGGISVSFDVTDLDGAVDRDIAGFGLLATAFAAFAMGFAVFHLRRLEHSVRRAHYALRDLLAIDPITSLHTRKHFFERAKVEWERLCADRSYGSVVLVDIDHFKKINHKYGYPAGDAILRQVADVLRENSRPEDTLGRYGGEEFVWLMPETNQAKAKAVAEKMHAALTGYPLILPSHSPVRISASIGVASFSAGRGPQAAPSLDKWIASADEALHQAMKGGGNQIVVYAPLDEAGA